MTSDTEDNHDPPECIESTRAVQVKERTIASRHGKYVAAVIPIEDLRLLERFSKEEMDRVDLADALEALKEAKKKGTVPLDDLIKELGA